MDGRLWKRLNCMCKEFCFQAEEGTITGNRHWQCRLRLKGAVTRPHSRPSGFLAIGRWYPVGASVYSPISSFGNRILPKQGGVGGEYNPGYTRLELSLYAYNGLCRKGVHQRPLAGFLSLHGARQEDCRGDRPCGFHWIVTCETIDGSNNLSASFRWVMRPGGPLRLPKTNRAIPAYLMWWITCMLRGLLPRCRTLKHKCQLYLSGAWTI